MISLNFFLGFSGVVFAAKRALVPRAALKDGGGGAHQKRELILSLFLKNNCINFIYETIVPDAGRRLLGPRVPRGASTGGEAEEEAPDPQPVRPDWGAGRRQAAPAAGRPRGRRQDQGQALQVGLAPGRVPPGVAGAHSVGGLGAEVRQFDPQKRPLWYILTIKVPPKGNIIC